MVKTVNRQLVSRAACLFVILESIFLKEIVLQIKNKCAIIYERELV
jgi:hypothetical protein